MKKTKWYEDIKNEVNKGQEKKERKKGLNKKM